VRRTDDVIELRATGMPLGLMPGMEYGETSYRLTDGETMVLTSDGITEAHNPSREMYGFGRLMTRIGDRPADDDVVAALISDLEAWTGDEAEQEDDITLVVVRRTSSAAESARVFDDRMLTSFTVASVEGNERVAMEKVSEAVATLGLEASQIDRLKTAVAETVMNAIEHGNEYDPVLQVGVEVLASERQLVVRVTDEGGDKEIPETVTPDLEAKLSGEQTPRGWGLFLIGQMVDEVRRWRDDGKHVVELVVERQGATG
jgi:anti-sigma regulatory factor (Ser/Thr protein kinase)